MEIVREQLHFFVPPSPLGESEGGVTVLMLGTEHSTK